jgi:putative FmdB family regulatory protein
MPIYEYACTACGERTEARQSFDDPPLEDCPHCGGKLRKLYSPVGIVFKGSGFYSTDQKSKKSGRDQAKDTSKSSSEGSTGANKAPEKKSESSPKPAADTSSSEKSA